MKKRYCSLAVLVAGLALASLEGARAQDWPQWRGANRDGKVTGFTAPDTWPAELAQAWKVEVGAGDATPVLVGDRLYVFSRQGEEEVLRCLSAADGKEIWAEKYVAKPVTGAGSRHPGPRSTPAVAGGKVVTLGAAGVLSCLDAATGKLAWRKDLFPGAVPQFFTGMSPLVVDGLVVTHVGGPGNGALIALDLATGEPKWQWAAARPDYGSPMLMAVAGVRQIVTPTEKSLAGIALADGKVLWQVPCVNQRMAYNASTPVVEGETVFYSGSGQPLKAFTVEKQGDGFAAKEAWANPEIAVMFSTPILKDGFLFGLSSSNKLFCVNARTGATAWSDTTPRGAGRGGFGAVLDAGPVLLLQPNGPELLVFKPSDKGYAEIAKVKVSGAETYASPVIAGKRVFVKDLTSVSLLTLP